MEIIAATGGALIERHFGVLWLRTVAEQITCSLMLLEFVPMHSSSQRFVSVAS